MRLIIDQQIGASSVIDPFSRVCSSSPDKPAHPKTRQLISGVIYAQYMRMEFERNYQTFGKEDSGIYNQTCAQVIGRRWMLSGCILIACNTASWKSA